MDQWMIVAAIFGFAPALLLMFTTFDKYTYPKVERPFFDDRKLFLLFTIGLMIGVIVAVLESPFPKNEIIIIILFALAQAGLMLVIMNLPRFQRRLDTTFYGTALGLGIGATMAFGQAFKLFGASGENTILDFVLVAMISVQLVALNGAIGGTIGIGCAAGLPWKFFAQAVLLQMICSLLMLPLYWGLEWFGIIGLVAATAFSLFTYYRLRKTMIPDIVDEAIWRMGKASKVKKV
ncbi:MAG: hypothetical protein WCK39_07515 [Methanomassiliicoccales archaeon]